MKSRQGHHFSSTPLQFTQRLKQPLGIPGRAQQMRGLYQSFQFIRGDNGHITRATPADKQNFPVISHPIQIRGQLFA